MLIDLPLILQQEKPAAFGSGLLVLPCSTIDMKSSVLLVWDVQDNKEKYQLPGGTAPVALSADEQLLAATDGEMVAIADMSDGTKRQQIASGRVHGLAWKPDGKRLVSMGWDLFQVWELDNDVPLKALPIRFPGTCDITFSPDGNWLAGYDRDARRTRLLDWSGRQKEHDFLGGKQPVFSLDSRRFANWSEQGAIVSETATGKRVKQFDFPDFIAVQSLALNAEGNLLAFGPKKGWNGVWDLDRDREILQLSAGPTVRKGVPSNLLTGQFSPDGQRLLSWSMTREGPPPELWDLALGRKIGSLDVGQNDVAFTRFSNNGNWLAVITFQLSANPNPEGRPRIGCALFALPSREKRLVISNVVEAMPAFSPDNRFLAVVLEDGSIQLWDIAAGKELFRWRSPFGEPRQFVFTPNGNLLLNDGRTLQQLDLKVLRQQLSVLGLGW